MKKLAAHIIGVSTISILASGAWAQSDVARAQLSEDKTYEQNLRWEASADKTITPQKVLRYVAGLRGESLNAPSRTEFQPIVNVHDDRVRLIAAIAFKF